MMSVQIVSKKDIDALLTAAANLQPCSDSLFRWRCRGAIYILDYVDMQYEYHQLGSTPYTLYHMSFNSLGQHLWAQNHDSFNLRYSECLEIPEYSYQPIVVPIVQALKCLDYYEYQTSGLSDWEEKVAYAFCNQLRRNLVMYLPGYEEALWGLDDD